MSHCGKVRVNVHVLNYLGKPCLGFAGRSRLIAKTKVLGDEVAVDVAKSLEKQAQKRRDAVAVQAAQKS